MIMIHSLKKFVFLWLSILLVYSQNAGAQTVCSYGSFSDSTWGSWFRESNTRWGVTNTAIRDIYYSYGSPINNQFRITRLGDFYVVPFSNDTIRLVPPNGAPHAIQLGDNLGPYNTSMPTPVNRISMTTRVTSECLSFLYALVMEYHVDVDDGDPFFMFRVWDSTGVNIIDSLTFYKWADVNDTPYFSVARQYPSTYLYRDWSEHRVNMSGLVGQLVTLEFVIADCSQQVHSGDVYLDNICFGSCCRSCDELFYDDPAFFVSSELHRTIEEIYQTDTQVCYRVNTRKFDIELFRCVPYGIRIFDMHSPQTTYWSYNDPHVPIVPGVGWLNNASREFCIDKSTLVNGQKELGIEFINSNGEVVCTLRDTVKPNLCCDGIVMLKEPAATGGECSGNIFFGIPENASCGIVGIRTSQPGYFESRGYSVGFVVPYCITEPGTKTITGYFVNAAGDTMCSKSIKIECPGVTPCAALKVQLKMHPNPLLAVPCCYNYHLNINPCFRDPNVFVIRRKNGDTLLQGNNILSAIPPLGFPALVIGNICNHLPDPVEITLEMLDINGNIICTVPVEIPRCNNIVIGTGGKNGGLNQNTDAELPDNSIQIQPNPADGSIKVRFSADAKSACTIRILDISGKMIKEEKMHPGTGDVTRLYDTSEWPRGVYFLQVLQNGNVQMKKFHVEHQR